MLGQVKGTYRILFIDKANIPEDLWKYVTYGPIVVSYRPEKADPNRTRLTVGGDKVNYPGYCGTPTTDLLTVKLLINIIISTPGARFMTIDIKDFYLMTPTDRCEYMRFKLENFPEDLIQQYTWHEKVT